VVDKEIGISDIVFIDSGNYERRVLQDLGYPVSWTSSDHLAAIDSILPLTRLTIVNYDDPGEVEDQIRSAQNLFEQYPNYSTDFLIKLSSEKRSSIDVKAFEKSVDEIAKFEIIGVTDNELGESFLEKCKNLVEIRESLDSAGLDIPIHIFGCFDPLSIILMFLCGADIFDGIGWVRYGIKKSLLIYNRSLPLLSRDWSTPDSHFQEKISANTLSYMTDLSIRLRTFCESQVYDDLELNEENMDLVKSFMNQALGKNLEEL
jgi:hypothetical protein